MEWMVHVSAWRRRLLMTTNTCDSSSSISEEGIENTLSEGLEGGEGTELEEKAKGMDAGVGIGWLGDWPWLSDKEGLV
jgi:hypothetical protein